MGQHDYDLKCLTGVGVTIRGVSSKLVQVAADNRLIVVERQGGVLRLYRVIEVADPPGRAPTAEEMASGALPGPIQPRTVSY
jgi:hypothetical protein